VVCLKLAACSHNAARFETLSCGRRQGIKQFALEQQIPAQLVKQTRNHAGTGIGHQNHSLARNNMASIISRGSLWYLRHQLRDSCTDKSLFC
jgi:hypothetical protein